MAQPSPREIARKHGEKLPTFSSRQEAERHWFALRDKHLLLFSEIAHERLDLNLDFTPPSLKRIEGWYFDLYETDSFDSVGTTRETFEICMAMYFGETAVRNTSARWIVEEYFLAPGKYELGIAGEGMTMMLNRFADHFRVPNNKRKQSLFRRYTQYFGRSKAAPLHLGKS